MEQGDKIGLVGMILSLGAVINLVTYFIYANIPLFQSYMGLLLIFTYAYVLGGGSVGLVLSIIGTAKSGSTFGIIGIIGSSLSLVIMFVFFFL